MITCRTCGRLGNFLFQFSATFCHALKNGFDYCMPLKSMNERAWPTPKIGKIKYGSPQPGKTFKQPSHAYHPIPNEDNLTLEGYWQSEKYFHGYKEQIAEALGFTFTPRGYVAIHVRRGDYLLYPDQFPVLPMEYYYSAIEYFRSHGFIKFRVYSDDIPFSKTQINSVYIKDIEVEYSNIRDPLTDMKDMHNAAGFIIANSSFSLFPALLRSDNPMVIAPADDRWYGPKAKHLETCDLMPERFIKM